MYLLVSCICEYTKIEFFCGPEQSLIIWLENEPSCRCTACYCAQSITTSIQLKELKSFHHWNPERVISHDSKSAAAHHSTHSFCLTKTSASLLHFHSQQSQQLQPIFPPCRPACSDSSVCVISTAQPRRPQAKIEPHLCCAEHPETLSS